MNAQPAATPPATPTARPRRDLRLRAALLALLLVVLIGGLLQWLTVVDQPTPPESAPALAQPELSPVEPAQLNRPPVSAPVEQTSTEEQAWSAPPPPIDPQQNPEGHGQQAIVIEAQARFQQAVVMLHAKRYDEAITALSRMLTLLPDNPDAYANLGFALLGKEDYPSAYAAFDRATDLNPAQANAYFGAAIALEGMGNLEGALGGMRSFLHLTDKGSGQIHVARARSAIWEWEAQLERGPWGPTKGVPPGFTREELKRNDQGVGVKMPIPGTEDEHGIKQYEIKYQDKFELFDR